MTKLSKKWLIIFLSGIIVIIWDIQDTPGHQPLNFILVFVGVCLLVYGFPRMFIFEEEKK